MDLSQLDIDAVRATQRLIKQGFEAYLVGGCVRDLLLGRQAKDYDIATEARPQQVKRVFPRNCRIIGRRFKLAHLHFHGNTKILECSTFRRTPSQIDNGDDVLITRDNEFGTAEEDALRRDFTVNALFLDPTRDTILDYTNGLHDVRDRVIRTIGDPVVRFREDPVRILRAAKFSGRLGFTVEPNTFAAMADTSGDLVRSAPPRLLEEIQRLLRGGHSLDSFQLLRDVGATRTLVPVLGEFLANAAHEQRVDFWRLLQALDHRVQDGHVPCNPVLLGALLVSPVLAKAERNPGRSPSSIAEELLGPLCASLRLPRRDAGCLKRICGVQHRFAQGDGEKRFRTEGFLHGPYFLEALELFELRTLARGESLTVADRWHAMANEVFGNVESHPDDLGHGDDQAHDDRPHDDRPHDDRPHDDEPAHEQVEPQRRPRHTPVGVAHEQEPHDDGNDVAAESPTPSHDDEGDSRDANPAAPAATPTTDAPPSNPWEAEAEPGRRRRRRRRGRRGDVEAAETTKPAVGDAANSDAANGDAANGDSPEPVAPKRPAKARRPAADDDLAPLHTEHEEDGDAPASVRTRHPHHDFVQPEGAVSDDVDVDVDAVVADGVVADDVAPRRTVRPARTRGPQPAKGRANATDEAQITSEPQPVEQADGSSGPSQNDEPDQRPRRRRRRRGRGRGGEQLGNGPESEPSSELGGSARDANQSPRSEPHDDPATTPASTTVEAPETGHTDEAADAGAMPTTVPQDDAGTDAGDDRHGRRRRRRRRGRRRSSDDASAPEGAATPGPDEATDEHLELQGPSDGSSPELQGPPRPPQRQSEPGQRPQREQRRGNPQRQQDGHGQQPGQRRDQGRRQHQQVDAQQGQQQGHEQPGRQQQDRPQGRQQQDRPQGRQQQGRQQQGRQQQGRQQQGRQQQGRQQQSRQQQPRQQQDRQQQDRQHPDRPQQDREQQGNQQQGRQQQQQQQPPRRDQGSRDQGNRRDRDRNRGRDHQNKPRDVDVVPRFKDRRGKIDVIEPAALDLSAFDVELDPKRVPTFGSIVEGKGRPKRRSPRVPDDGVDDYKPPPPPGGGTGPTPPPPPPSSDSPDTFGDW